MNAMRCLGWDALMNLYVDEYHNIRLVDSWYNNVHVFWYIFD